MINTVDDIKAGEQLASNLQVFDLAEVENLVERGYTAVPLVEKLELRETAGAVYERLRGDGPSFLLESADPAEHQGRYSFIGLAPEAAIRLEENGMMVNGVKHEFDDPYTFVDELIARRRVAPIAGLPPFYGGAAGLFGYDLARYREPTIGEAPPDALQLPEMALMVPGVTIAFDHYKGEVSIISNVLAEPGMDTVEVADRYQAAVEAIRATKQQLIDPVTPSADLPTSYGPLTFNSNMTPETFKDAVRTAKASAEAGDTFQIVPSQRLSSDETVDSDFAHAVFSPLKRLNPSRYAFLFEFGDFQVTGCSPETLVKVTDGYLEHMAIAGSRGRGKDAIEDERLAAELLQDPKELAEHRMLVDLSRNDVNQVCDPESVAVATHAVIETHSHVMHITSKVTGELSEGQTALDALASILPAGTLSGAPKVSAMQRVDELEPDKRGFYGGAVGYVTPGGDLDSCIFIRSIVVDKAGRVHVQAGAGVVADSDPQKELDETFLKMAAPLRAIEEVCHPTHQRQRLLEVDDAKPRLSRRVRRLGAKVVLLDNYDSYTYNIRQSLIQLGVEVEVLRNDVPARELIRAKPDFLVVSPGPHTPRQAGLSMGAMRYFPEKGIPSLGICLGHQALTMAFGGEVVRHRPVHGKTSTIQHDGRTIFAGIPSALQVMRYHSLVASEPLPDTLERSAYTVESDGQEIVMAIMHKTLPAEGVQFHPESFYTDSGPELFRNFLQRQP